jgi:hypothetical protein
MTIYIYRRSEQFDLNKYHNRKSSLTSREQKQYLNLHVKYAKKFFTPKNPTDREKHHMKEFSVRSYFIYYTVIQLGTSLRTFSHPFLKLS